MDDPNDLERFVKAQADIIEIAERELAEGRKRSHWMWFVFPQVEGLGLSAMSARYAIRSAEEAEAYLAHPVLGPRLKRCVGLAAAHRHRSAHDIFGAPDDAKLRSCLTLFAEVSDDPVFARALEQFFDGSPCLATLRKLGRELRPSPAPSRGSRRSRRESR